MCPLPPGTSETPAPVFVDGKEFRTLRAPNIATEFKAVMMDYIDQRDGAGDKVPASAVTAAE
jgi:(E)-4-hydroxy-3-methylbut-2-enyl-diphosphate synthase